MKKYKDLFFPKLFPETEIRRRCFKSPPKQKKFIGKYLEVVQGNVRFIYDLKTDKFYWQFKKSLEAHYVVVPTIEKCVHSIESQTYPTILECLNFKIKPSFFFKQKPSIKTIFFHSEEGVVLYERITSTEKINYIECELSSGLLKYLHLCQHQEATRQDSDNVIEPVVVVLKKHEDVILYAIKWDGLKTIRTIPCNFMLLNNNKYVLEKMSDGCYIIVDILNNFLSPIQRIQHMRFIQFIHGDYLLKTFGIKVQNFFTSMDTVDSFYKKTENDGYIGVTSKNVIKIKKQHTVDLLLFSERKHFVDNDGVIYITTHNLELPKVNSIYECTISKSFLITSVIRRRGDKLYPNSRRVVESCCVLE